MTGELSYENLLRKAMQGELRVLNAHMPRQQKNLTELLGEEYPSVTASDGNAYLFKKKELNYLAGILNAQEQETLFLPILIELGESRDEARIICKTGIEEKVISTVLGMPLSCREGRIHIYKSQLGDLRNTLRTATQYIFTAVTST